jgi:hypothetical protein
MKSPNLTKSPDWKKYIVWIHHESDCLGVDLSINVETYTNAQCEVYKDFNKKVNANKWASEKAFELGYEFKPL